MAKSTSDLATIEALAEDLAQRELGYEDRFEPQTIRATVERHEGGYLIYDASNGDRFDELHVFTHGGTHLPRRLAAKMSSVDAETLARSIHRNRDSSTSALAMEMIRGLGDPQKPRRLIAFFDVARVVIDANRIHVSAQIADDLYAGTGALRHDLAPEQKAEIIDELWGPWRRKVDSMIEVHGIRAVFHHHTYDPVGTGQAAHETTEQQYTRPAGMVCQRAPASMSRYGKSTLLDETLLESVVETLRHHFRHLDAEAEVEVDWPYRAPEMPFLPRLGTADAKCFETIIYEARKDLLASREGLERLGLMVEELSSQAAKHCGYARVH